MQAAHENYSFIKVNFGDSQHEQKSPVDISLILDLFSQEQNIIRKQIETAGSIQLPQTCFAFILDSKSASTKQTVERLNNSDIIKNINENSPSKVNFYSHEDKIYLVVEGEQISSGIEGVEGLFAELKNEAATQAHQIKLKIRSSNDLGKVSQFLNTRSYLGWIDCLHVEFGFVKTDLVTKFLNIILENIIGLPQATSLTKAFKKLNLELNMSSSRTLLEYPKIQVSKIVPPPKNDFASILSESGIEHGKFFAFNPTIYMHGDLQASGLSTLLSSFYK